MIKRQTTPHVNHQQRPYIILAIVAFGVFIAADDLTVISTMLPQMITDFNIPLPAGLDDAAWIVSSYLITHIVAMPLFGRISDLYGRRFVFISCMLAFAVGSFMVARATTLNFLIFSRIIQAIGGGGVVPVAMAVVGDVFEPERRAFALGILGAIDTLGWIIGPLYGAFWVRYYTWHWQFYINIPISLLTIVLAWFYLQHLKAEETTKAKGLDWPGAIFLSAGLILVNVGLANSGGQATTGPSFDFSNTSVIPTWQKVLPYFLGSVVAFAIFIWLNRRVKYPLLDLNMFRLKNFGLACLINFVVGLTLIIAMVAVPLFINTITAQSSNLSDFVKIAAMDSGQVLSALTGAMAIASLIGGWLCGRFGYRLPTSIGLIGMMGGFLLMSQWSATIGYWSMAAHLALAGFGFGLVISPVGTAVINAVVAEMRGIASSTVLILRLMGMSVGLSSLTAWGLYRFDVLSLPYTIPELPQYIGPITTQILTEIFLASAIFILASVLLAVNLQPDTT